MNLFWSKKKFSGQCIFCINNITHVNRIIYYIYEDEFDIRVWTVFLIVLNCSAAGLKKIVALDQNYCSRKYDHCHHLSFSDLEACQWIPNMFHAYVVRVCSYWTNVYLTSSYLQWSFLWSKESGYCVQKVVNFLNIYSLLSNFYFLRLSISFTDEMFF